MPLWKKLQMIMGMLKGKPMMPCDEVLDRLFEYLDGEMPDIESQQVKDHLDACQKCYPRLDFERTFLDAVQKVKDCEGCPDSVREKVLAAIQGGAEPLR